MGKGVVEAFNGLVQRVLPQWADSFLALEIAPKDGQNCFEVEGVHGKVVIKGDTTVSLAMGLYAYLKQVMHVNISWCGNREIVIKKPVTTFLALQKTITQKYRVYMNYCTLSYTMAYWDFDQWQKEIDFMALRGINMPLAVIGTEVVMFETLLKFGFSKEESLRTVCAPAFQAWQWMTNIDSYEPLIDENLLKKRLVLGQQIMERYLELGMFPIQQGFSGHMPLGTKARHPNAKIALKPRWCDFAKTEQLDPTCSMFQKFGTEFLNIQAQYFGAHGFYACDPFHECAPPRLDYFYLHKVGKAIDGMYKKFQPDSVWVMQSWSIRKTIALAVPKNRLLILDLDGARCQKTHNFWGYSFISGHLHNFGGKNSLHGDLQFLAQNKYAKLKAQGAKVVGAGLFPEGIEQNPVYYDLLFDVLTENRAINLDCWLQDYTRRRYGAENEFAQEAWKILLKSAYAPHEGAEDEAGSMLAARPQVMPYAASPYDKIVLRYDNNDLWQALQTLLKAESALSASDGYRFDVADLTRQAVSNMVYLQQQPLPKLVKERDIDGIRALGDAQLATMREVDSICGTRSELSLARWLDFAKKFGDTADEKRYAERTARLLITIWGDVRGDPGLLYDYAWKEWSGLIADFYIPRWEKFYTELCNTLKAGKNWDEGRIINYCRRSAIDSTPFSCELFAFEKAFVDDTKTYPLVQDSEPFDLAKQMLKKYAAVK